MRNVSSLVVLVAIGAVALAQPTGDEPVAPGPAPAPASPPPGSDMPRDPYVEPVPAPPPPAPPPKPRPKDPHVDSPENFLSPTAWLLPAAVLYSRTSIDTGGGLANDSRVGLGDVAEFGVASLDTVRVRTDATSEPAQLQPYFTASFRMGVAEHRLFADQPGLVLGFRKSFRHDEPDFKTRVAELTLVASKHFGSRAAITVGGAFWDAELITPTRTETLHGYSNINRQLRAFGSVEARPFDKSEIVVDLGYAPVFCPVCVDGEGIRLRPQLAWGVRYEVSDFMRLESGVRVPDIGDFNLLNAQIFGQVTFTSWAIRHAVDDIR